MKKSKAAEVSGQEAEPSAETKLLLATARALQAHMANHRHYRGTEMLTPHADELGKAIAAVENPEKQDGEAQDAAWAAPSS